MQSPLLPVLSLASQEHMQHPVTDLALRIDARQVHRVVPRGYMPISTAYLPPCSNSEGSGNEDEDVASEDVASNVSTRAHYDNKDTVTVQFSSICSPFLSCHHSRPLQMFAERPVLKQSGCSDGAMARWAEKSGGSGGGCLLRQRDRIPEGLVESFERAIWPWCRRSQG